MRPGLELLGRTEVPCCTPHRMMVCWMLLLCALAMDDSTGSCIGMRHRQNVNFKEIVRNAPMPLPMLWISLVHTLGQHVTFRSQGLSVKALSVSCSASEGPQSR